MSAEYTPLSCVMNNIVKPVKLKSEPQCMGKVQTKDNTRYTRKAVQKTRNQTRNEDILQDVQKHSIPRDCLKQYIPG